VGAVRRLLRTERLVTIAGSGGVGKTSLAADLARRHDDDTHWVALSPLNDPDDLPRALAAALGLQSARGDVLDACAHLLAAGPRLLVLDNCEHVLDRVRDVVSRLMHACPTITLLTTTRERLGLAEECTFRLTPLAVPEPASPRPELAPALALFSDRARRSRPGFELTGDDLDAAVAIVRRLEGVPLAIELAASRLSSLGVEALHDRLDRALDLLESGRSSAEARHQTLRATLAWSYDLLPTDRQRLLRHLAVFPDGVDLLTGERLAAEVVVEGDPAAALGHLVDASMLGADLDGEPRYRMLETLRAFGLEQLEANGELEAAELRFLDWAEELCEWVDTTLRTPDEPHADARLRRELANLRAAWALALQRDALDTAIAIVVALDDAAQWRELPEVWSWAQVLVHHPDL
jgi:predicted ATPase